MATFVIDPTKDTYLSGRRVNDNYGDQTTLKLGDDYVLGAREYNVVMEFDLSGSDYADVTAIVDAEIQLKEVSVTGSYVNTITVRRLGIDFIEADPNGCTWNKPDFGASTTWSGGEDYAETNVADETFEVGYGKDDVDIDVLAFVRDAIQRRAGVLRLVFFMSAVATQRGLTTFGSSRHATVELRPTLTLIIAERMVWTGAVNGSMLENGNWELEGHSANTPTTQDFAIFNSGSVDANTGNLQCHTLMIAEGYTGTIGTDADNLIQVSGSSPTYDNPKRMFNQKRGNFFIDDVTTPDYGDIGTQVLIADSQKGSVYSALNSQTFSVTGGEVELLSDQVEPYVNNSITISRASKSGTKVKLSGLEANLVTSHCKLTLENGCASGIFVDGSKVTCTDGTLEDATISGRSIVVYRGKLIDGTTTIYNGRLTFLKNENAEIVTEDILLYKGAVFDTRTGTGAWSPNATPSIDITGGGNFMVDVGKTLTLGV